MKRAYVGLALVGGALALGACSGDQVASTAQSQTPLAGVVCPPAGTVVRRDNGSYLRYGGADPADPATCILGTPNGGTVKALGGLIVTHPINAAQRRQALASLFPLAPGRASHVRYGLVSPANPAAHSIPFEESFRVTGESTVQLADGPRQTWVVQGALTSIADAGFRFRSTYQIDKQTGAVLAYDNSSPTGAVVGAAALPYRVLEMTVPGQVASTR